MPYKQEIREIKICAVKQNLFELSWAKMLGLRY